MQTWRWMVACAEELAIQSFDGTGRLTFNEVSTAAVYVVESAVTPTGGWTTVQASRGPVNEINVDTNGLSTCFYRLVAGVTNSVSPEPTGMALIPASSFQMGNAMDPNESWDDGLPVHTVYVSSFYMDKTEVTKAKWDEVYAWAVTHGYSFDNAGSGKASNHPVHSISWDDIVKWCNARSQKEGKTPAYYTSSIKTTENLYKTGQVDIQNDWVQWDAGYRLPTEAEWEKSARGGFSGKRFPWGNLIDHTCANYYGFPSGCSYDQGYEGFDARYAIGDYPCTSPVGSFSPNGYGLYDMAGNLWEWCWDRYGNSYYASSPCTDPRGPSLGSDRVDRGGCWYNDAYGCRATFRGHGLPAYASSDFGFRAVLPSVQ